MRWRSGFYVDLILLFGLRSVPFIFDSVAEMVEWILRNNYSLGYLFHYLDDFLTLGPGSSSECANSFAIARIVFFRLDLPLHSNKCKGRTTCLVLLGIELNFGSGGRSPSRPHVCSDPLVTPPVGYQAIVHSQRIGVINWHTSPCLQLHPLLSRLLKAYDQPALRIPIS